MTIEAVELQKFKLGANVFFIRYGWTGVYFLSLGFKYFRILMTYCFSFMNLFIYLFFVFVVLFVPFCN